MLRRCNAEPELDECIPGAIALERVPVGLHVTPVSSPAQRSRARLVARRNEPEETPSAMMNRAFRVATGREAPGRMAPNGLWVKE